jgi:hypothetical protein
MTEHDRTACELPMPGEASARSVATYEAPRLEVLGDLRDVTLGASRGAIESGANRTFRR